MKSKYLTLVKTKTNKIMTQKTIGLFIGSLRKEANSRKIAKNLIKMTPEGFTFKIIEIGQLEFYNQDFDDHNQVPDSYTAFRKEVSELDGLIFITPEYNRSMPAVLKNALDVASRPFGKNVWNNKPGAVISSSTGAIGGFGANHHLRQSLTFLNIPTMQQPEIYLGKLKPDVFDENGYFNNEKTTSFIQNFVDAYVKWFQQLTK